MWFSSKRNSKPTLPTPKEGDSTASDASSEEARYSRERRRSASFADPWAGVDVRDEMPPAFLEKWQDRLHGAGLAGCASHVSSTSGAGFSDEKRDVIEGMAGRATPEAEPGEALWGR